MIPRQIAACMLLLFIYGGDSSVNARTWTDVSGQYTVEAEFVVHKEGEVYLRRPSGMVINLPLNKLSQADQDFVVGLDKAPEPAPQPVFEPGPDNPKQIATLKGIGFNIHGRDGNAQTIIISEKLTTDENLKHLAGLKNVETITMRGAGVTDAGLASLANLPTLLSLNIYDATNVTGSGFAHLAASKDLKSIELSRCPITDEGVAHLENFPQLERLMLNSTAITSECGASLASLAKLRELVIGGTAVDDAILQHLGELQQLILLSLASTKVDGSGLAGLAEAESLAELRLNSCPIKEMHLATLHRLTQLKKLHLLEVEAEQQTWIELFQALPNCQIYRPPE